MRRLALVALLFLAACASGRQMAERPIPHARGIPSGFGDTAPHAWSGLRPDRLAIHGIDAARYQGQINWGRAKAAGVSFAYLKATEGGDRVDPEYADNAAAARAAGVAVGAYHFYYFCTSPEDQAAWFIAHAPARSGDLPPVLDVEWNSRSPTCRLRPDAATTRAMVKTFIDIVAHHYGQQPVVYTTPDFFRATQLAQLGIQDLWLRSVAGHPSETYAGTRWTFWQYTGSGVVPGVGPDVDLNAFAGSAAEWQAWRARRSF